MALFGMQSPFNNLGNRLLPFGRLYRQQQLGLHPPVATANYGRQVGRAPNKAAPVARTATGTVPRLGNPLNNIGNRLLGTTRPNNNPLNNIGNLPLLMLNRLAQQRQLQMRPPVATANYGRQVIRGPANKMAYSPRTNSRPTIAKNLVAPKRSTATPYAR